jgi:hypothetical protein
VAAELAEDTFTVGSFSAGYVHDFPQLGAIVPGFGVVGMIDVIGSAPAGGHASEIRPDTGQAAVKWSGKVNPGGGWSGGGSSAASS